MATLAPSPFNLLIVAQQDGGLFLLTEYGSRDPMGQAFLYSTDSGGPLSSQKLGNYLGQGYWDEYKGDQEELPDLLGERL